MTAFLTSSERAFLRAVSDLGYCNPFLPKRIEYGQAAPGPEFSEAKAVWSLRVDDPSTLNVNNTKITERVAVLVQKLRDRLASGIMATEPDLVLYEDAALFLLYNRYQNRFYELLVRALEQKRGLVEFEKLCGAAVIQCEARVITVGEQRGGDRLLTRLS